jgi:MerR family transcriptional regulator/heat shock protein HspR
MQGATTEKFSATGGVDVTVPQPAGERGVYGISVAAELVGMGVQNLRLYEARGLLAPGRTDGGTRRYSADDLDRLRRIGDLLDAGLNLAGVGMVLDLETQNVELRAELDARHDAPGRPRPAPARPAPEPD